MSKLDNIKEEVNHLDLESLLRLQKHILDLTEYELLGKGLIKKDSFNNTYANYSLKGGKKQE